MAWNTTQPSLLARLRDPADQLAWMEFDRQYGELIVRYCRSRGLQQSDAEDVRQVVLMNLASALRGFCYSPDRGRFRNYLGRVVRNAISRARARPGPSGCALDLEWALAAETARPTEVDDRWEREWVGHHLRRAMRKVRRAFEPRSIAAFDRLLAGAAPDQISREMGMTTEAVHKIKQRVRDRLKAAIALQIEEEERVDA